MKALILLVVMGIVFAGDLGITKKQAIAKYGKDYKFNINGAFEELSFGKDSRRLEFEEEKCIMSVVLTTFEDEASYTKKKNDLLMNRGKQTVVKEDSNGYSMYNYETNSIIKFIEDDGNYGINYAELTKNLFWLMTQSKSDED